MATAMKGKGLANATGQTNCLEVHFILTSKIPIAPVFQNIFTTRAIPSARASTSSKVL